MANIKSSAKRAVIAEKRNQKNTAIKSEIKTAIKKFDKAAEEKADNVTELYTDVVSKVDKAVSKGVIKKNAAARKKSQVSKAYNAAK